ncbi:hypothetical protein C8R44DRAFT_726469 [Mycena epipterygia]|nr:hypothetical protein C8R44DRAFT_726469 [Mycena epipterygia]
MTLANLSAFNSKYGLDLPAFRIKSSQGPALIIIYHIMHANARPRRARRIPGQVTFDIGQYLRSGRYWVLGIGTTRGSRLIDSVDAFLDLGLVARLVKQVVVGVRVTFTYICRPVLQRESVMVMGLWEVRRLSHFVWGPRVTR